MKLAIFTDTYLPQVNGVARTVDKIYSHLHRKNIDCLLFAPDCGSYSAKSADLHIYPAFNLPLYPECKIGLPSYSGIRQLLHKFKPDLIHSVTEFSMGLCGLKYAKEHNIPVAASYTTNFHQYMSYYKLGFLERGAELYLRWFHNQCYLNYCPSQEIKSMLATKGFTNLTIWGRGIDTKFFSPEKKNNILKEMAPDKNLFFLYVGRLAPEKDLDVLFKAWQEVSQKLPGTQLVITGDGPRAEELKQKYGLTALFTGYRHGEELASIYAGAGVFVFPSTTETFGNVVLEAMSSGLPVIGASAGGVKNLLVDNFNGFACTPRNHHEMANAMLRLGQDKQLRSELSRQAREYALNHAWDDILNNLVHSYEELISRDKEAKTISLGA